MAKIIYKEGLEGQNRLDCIEGIEIDLLNGQCALIYPKYADAPLLGKERIDDWKAKIMTGIEVLKVTGSKEATDELLSLDSPAAKFVRQFKSNVYGQFNMPTLLASMELQHQKVDIDALAETIVGADLLGDFGCGVWSCSRCCKTHGWVANGGSGFASYGYWCSSFLVVPTIVYDSVI